MYPILLSENKCTTVALWHSGLSHSNFNATNKVLSTCNLGSLPRDLSIPCSACMMGKAHSLPYYESSIVYSKPLKLVYSDLPCCHQMVTNII